MAEEQEHPEPTPEEVVAPTSSAGEPSPPEAAAPSPPEPTAQQPAAEASPVQNTFDQAELDALFAQAAAAATTGASETMAAAADGLANAQAEMDALAAEMAAAVAAEARPPGPAGEAAASSAGESPAVLGTAGGPEPASAATPFAPPEMDGAAVPAPTASIELLDDVELDVKIELGRTVMYIEDVLRLGVGSVVQLDKLAGDPVDIYVNDRLVARGEVLVLNDNFCVRINDIRAPIPELEG
jgi:flagellar motor switch protein FliN/FliY